MVGGASRGGDRTVEPGGGREGRTVLPRKRNLGKGWGTGVLLEAAVLSRKSKYWGYLFGFLQKLKAEYILCVNQQSAVI